MDDFVLSIYLDEVHKQAQYAINAIIGLNRVMQRLQTNDPPLTRQESHTVHQEVFRAIHSFLTHASNVSRLLWPAGTGGEPPRESSQKRQKWHARIGRGQTLRAAIGVEDDHPLRRRKLRDHLEHFDERLDDWQASTKHKIFVQDNIGPRDVISIEGMEDGDRMRWYEPHTQHFLFRGEEYDLQALVDGVSDILQKSATALHQRRSDP